jgi:hypothetical protein
LPNRSRVRWREEHGNPEWKLDRASPAPPGNPRLEAFPTQGSAGHREGVPPACIPEDPNLASGPPPAAESALGSVEVDPRSPDGFAAVGTVDELVVHVQLALELVEPCRGQRPADGIRSLALHGRPDDVDPSAGADTFDWRADDNALKHVVPNALVRPEAQHPVPRHVDRANETGGQPLAEEVRDGLGHEGGVFDVVDPGLAAAPPSVWTDGPGMQPGLATARAASREIAASGYELNSSATRKHWHGLLLVGQDDRLARLVATLRQNSQQEPQRSLNAILNARHQTVTRHACAHPSRASGSGPGWPTFHGSEGWGFESLRAR